MNIHIALYKWKPTATDEQVRQTLAELEALVDKISGIVEISTARNTSRYSQGFTHVIMVRANSTEAIDVYKAHPDHSKIAERLDAMEDVGIGVDFETK